MKKLTKTIAFTICSVWLVSCGNSVPNASQENQPNNAPETKADSSNKVQTDTEVKANSSNKPQANTEASTNKSKTNTEISDNSSNKVQTNTEVKGGRNKQVPAKQPTIGTVTSMVQGDLKCYVTLLDENRIERNVGASFEVCEQEKTFLNKKVRNSYEILSVNDCESIEPCGKSKKESLITKMEIIEDGNSQAPTDSQTLSNGEWTITVGNAKSWSGVNGTGNLSYRGCDANGKCINLTGGKTTCRNGSCTTGWANGDYFYILETPISNPDQPEGSDSSTTLTVKKGAEVILTAKGLKAVSP
ncbi:hypothetical protein [Coleofasciculus sp. FACHB-1120]|uniref:hypothetical protein n=1 Tax=Coleofasciculus sp. FACHB-1120 TaxID=2692783 RepID=UPI001682095B|nr:hypothetical protein [Coleofasciculus sp. FACHB-1120]MBD2742328.1 hypothetical protein [Coleofasciculus sp. FACHB-1120]